LEQSEQVLGGGICQEEQVIGLYVKPASYLGKMSDKEPTTMHTVGAAGVHVKPCPILCNPGTPGHLPHGQGR